MNRQLKTKLFGFFFGMWMAFTLTIPVSAQWTVHVNSDTSPTTFQMLQQMGSQLAAQSSIATATNSSKVAQALEYVKTAERWIATVEQYTTQIMGDVRRFTSLKGIMSTVEKQLGLSDDTLKALADIGEIIRGSFTVKNQFLSLVRTRLSMIESLERRARSGIFNPQADLQDMEEYLRYSIGREAATRVATFVKLKETDPLLERLNYELEKVRAERAAKQKELDSINQQLGREGGLSTRPRVAGSDQDGNSTTSFDGSRQSLSPEAVSTLTARASSLEEQIQKLVEQEQKLVNEIQERYESIQKNYDSAYLKGRYWSSVIDGWNDFDVIKREELENMIDLYGTTGGTNPAPEPVSGQQ
ncbi:MAG TPA: hypothetical protein VK308_10045 [Pyrinomonadaceae bacterium]|nr:hypothetical protein [Pyrinomonadaceae bacterium]